MIFTNINWNPTHDAVCKKFDMKKWPWYNSPHNMAVCKVSLSNTPRIIWLVCISIYLLWVYTNLQVAKAFVRSTTQWRIIYTVTLPYMLLHLGTGWRYPACTIRMRAEVAMFSYRKLPLFLPRMHYDWFDLDIQHKIVCLCGWFSMTHVVRYRTSEWDKTYLVCLQYIHLVNVL